MAPKTSSSDFSSSVENLALVPLGDNFQKYPVSFKS